MNTRRLIEQISVRTCCNHQQVKLAVTLAPQQKPIRFNVAFPNAVVIATQKMRTIFLRQFAFFRQNAYNLTEKIHIQSSLLATLQIFIKASCGNNPVHYTPRLLNISSTSENSYKFPLRISSRPSSIPLSFLSGMIFQPNFLAKSFNSFKSGSGKRTDFTVNVVSISDDLVMQRYKFYDVVQNFHRK